MRARVGKKFASYAFLLCFNSSNWMRKIYRGCWIKIPIDVNVDPRSIHVGWMYTSRKDTKYDAKQGGADQSFL